MTVTVTVPPTGLVDVTTLVLTKFTVVGRTAVLVIVDVEIRMTTVCVTVRTEVTVEGAAPTVRVIVFSTVTVLMFSIARGVGGVDVVVMVSVRV